MPIELEWFARIWEYLSAIGIYWWAGLLALLALERIAERLFHNFWKKWLDPWLTPQRRKQALIIFAILAFLYGNFRAFDDESRMARTAASQKDFLQGQLNTANGQIGKLQNDVVKLQAEIERLRPQLPQKESGNPDGLYQLDELVGTVVGARVDQGNSIVTFQAVRAAGKMDQSRNVEYRNYILRCNGLPAAPPPNTIVGMAIGVSAGVRCTILELRK